MRETTRREPGSKPIARNNNTRMESVRGGADAKSRTVGQAARSAVMPAGMKERADKALASVLFVQFPNESLEGLGIQGLAAGTPIPVQIAAPIVKFDISMVRPESIIAGILRVLAWQPDHANADQYRALVKALRPGLLAELSDAGLAKAMAKEWEIAEEILLALAGLYPEAPEPLLDLALLREEHAKLYREEMNDAQAEEEDELAHACYRSLLAMEPPFAPAYYHAAFFFIKTRLFDRAVSLLTSFIGLSDDGEKIQRASQVLKKLQELGYLDNAFKEAYDFIQLGEEEKGLELAKEFTSRYPAVWNGWFLIGWANRRLGRWEDGVEAFRKAVEYGSKEADTYNELALCLIETGDFSGAREQLEKALALEPENVKIIANLGALAFRVGRKGEALGFFRTALEIDPADALAQDWIDRLERDSDSGGAESEEE